MLATEQLPMTLDPTVSPGMFTQRFSQDPSQKQMPLGLNKHPLSQSTAMLHQGSPKGPHVGQDPLNSRPLTGDEDNLLHTAKRALRKIEKSQDPDSRHSQSLQDGGDTMKFNQ